MEKLIEFLDSEVGKSLLLLNCGKHGNKFYAVITIQGGYENQFLSKAEQLGLTNYKFEYFWSGNTLYVIEKV